MPPITLNGRLPFLREWHAEELNSRLNVREECITVSEFVTLLGIGKPEGLALIAELVAGGAGRLYVVVFHPEADGDTPVDFLDSAAGFPVVPWHCSGCDRDVAALSELRAEPALYLPKPVRVAWAADG